MTYKSTLGKRISLPKKPQKKSGNTTLFLWKNTVFCDSELWHGKDREKRKYHIKNHRDFLVT
ncbi:MAG: hypothetical protein B6I19_04295 [Bacteroidetes bacterium 4572_114]|nr:MAG: hypothetical protein B6I19_04295 [Bacteroidetes bacterium 4572_114]